MLRYRIMVLFLGFAILPVALLAAGDYLQSLTALRAAIDARGEATAAELARQVERRYAGARAELRAAAATAVSSPRVPPTADTLLSLWETGPEWIHEVRLIRDHEVAWRVQLQPDPGACHALSLVISHAVAGGAGDRLEGLLHPQLLLVGSEPPEGRIGSSGYVQLVSPMSGRILFDSRCRSTPDMAPPVIIREARALAASGSPASRAVSHSLDGSSWHAAVAVADGPQIGVVVHASDQELLAPFRISRLRYLSKVLLLLFATGTLFFFLTGREFDSLRTLTAAADEIRVGNLRPWLPPPGDHEVGRLSLAFRNMIDRLSESIRQVELTQKLAAVGELAAYLSHEIRNPLSSIRLSLQSLHRDLRGGFIPDDADRVIEIALGEVKRLEGVVSTVLEIGRQQDDSGERVCAVHDVLEETLEILGPKIRAQGVELDFVPRASRDVVRGEAEALRGVWINLVVNALDALRGTADPRIRVSTWTGPAAPDELHVRFADNGPGVPPDIAQSIFQPFFTTKLQGNGIGLPTALRTVQPWGGTITYEPVAAGTGAVFVVRLKLVAPEPPTVPVTGASPTEAALPS